MKNEHALRNQRLNNALIFRKIRVIYSHSKNINMKNSILFLFISLFFLSAGCAQQANVDALLENQETKNEIFTAIMQDEELMNDFMNEMMANENAMMSMRGNQQMMGHMMDQGHMRTMMQENPDMQKTMMNNMMQNGAMMSQMMSKMHQQGMISEDCLQAAQKRMQEQGMPMEGMEHHDGGEQ